MPPPLHLFHPGRVCIAREGDGWVGDLEREQNRSKVESDLGGGEVEEAVSCIFRNLELERVRKA